MQKTPQVFGSFVLLNEGDLVVLEQVKRVRKRPDGKTDVWLVGEDISYISAIKFDEFIQLLTNMYATEILVPENVHFNKRDLDHENTIVLQKPKRHFPPLEEDT